jgi:phenylacetate-coenzyme A ligase PaaK-like adenylate-forming protein
LEQGRTTGIAPAGPRPYVQAKIEEAAQIHANNDQNTRQLLETIRRLDGTKIVLAGGPGNLHRIAADGLAQGIEGFAPGSIVRTFGGMKGFPRPDAMEATIKRFAGVDRIGEAYGMTEVTSAFFACDRGNFHIPPWVVPMIIDPASGSLQPRDGRRKGRAAFMDLMPTTYWGGVVSADIIEIDWDICGCGRTSPHVRPGITRMPGDDGDEYAIGTASNEAVHSALHALTWNIGE